MSRVGRCGRVHRGKDNAKILYTVAGLVLCGRLVLRMDGHGGLPAWCGGGIRPCRSWHTMFLPVAYNDFALGIQCFCAWHTMSRCVSSDGTGRVTWHLLVRLAVADCGCPVWPCAGMAVWLPCVGSRCGICIFICYLSIIALFLRPVAYGGAWRMPRVVMW